MSFLRSKILIFVCLQSGVKVIPLDWWPVTRDCIAYGFTVAVLICVIHDERIEWYEALTLVALYVLYIAVMYFDKNVQKCFRSKFFKILPQ